MYLHVSPYREVLDGIVSALSHHQGLITLAGPAGAGKTALCERLISQLRGQGTRVIHFAAPPGTIETLQSGILQQSGLSASGSFTRTFTDYLLGQSSDQHPVVLLVDQAQDLPLNVFNAMRLLCNVKERGQLLMRLILCGRSNVNAGSLLASNSALNQDESVQLTLSPLSLDELRNFYWQYWRQQAPEFDMPAVPQLQALLTESGGLPGTILPLLEKYRPVQVQRVEVSAPVEKAHKKLESSGWLSPRWLAIELAVVVVLVAGAYLLHETPAEPAPRVEAAAVPITVPVPVTVDEPITPPAEALAIAAPATALPVVATPATETSPARPEVVSQPAIEALLETWTGAWQQRNLDGYFAAYSIDFVPPNEVTNASWRAQRQRSISNASNIAIKWRELTVESQNEDSAVVNVWLDYDSATYRDSTLKQLQLRRDGSELHIAAENNLRVEKR